MKTACTGRIQEETEFQLKWALDGESSVEGKEEPFV